MELPTIIPNRTAPTAIAHMGTLIINGKGDRSIMAGVLFEIANTIIMSATGIAISQVRNRMG